MKVNQFLIYYSWYIHIEKCNKIFWADFVSTFLIFPLQSCQCLQICYNFITFVTKLIRWRNKMKQREFVYLPLNLSFCRLASSVDRNHSVESSLSKRHFMQKPRQAFIRCATITGSKRVRPRETCNCTNARN